MWQRWRNLKDRRYREALFVKWTGRDKKYIGGVVCWKDCTGWSICCSLPHWELTTYTNIMTRRVTTLRKFSWQFWRFNDGVPLSVQWLLNALDDRWSTVRFSGDAGIQAVHRVTHPATQSSPQEQISRDKAVTTIGVGSFLKGEGGRVNTMKALREIIN